MNGSAVTCRDVVLEPVGCFVDKRTRPRPIPELVFTDRNSKDSKYSGVTKPAELDSKYISDLVCRCARSALKKGYTTVGVQEGKWFFLVTNKLTCFQHVEILASELCFS